jgi:hypothetical protein
MRLVTRPDFDGLACGAVITAMEDIDAYLFVEPKPMQDGMVEIRRGDIIANLPYDPNCRLWFDHHITNSAPGFDRPLVSGKGGFRLAPSAARVVYEYYTDELKRQDSEARNHTAKIRNKTQAALEFLSSDRITALLKETDKIDAALLKPEDVLHPEGYVLISMTIDGKRKEEEPYWLRLIDLLRDASLQTTLSDKEVRHRCEQILDAQEELRKILLDRTSLKGNVIFVDLRGIKSIPDGNRFLLYTLFPKGNISLKIADDTQRENRTAISVGYNIFNTTSKVNVGALLQRYGGGGHAVVGSCRVANEEAERAIGEIFEAIKE